MNKSNFFMTFLLLIFAISLIGCSSENNQFESTILNDAEVNFLNQGELFQTGEMNTYTVEVTDSSGSPLQPDSVYIYMNMEMMNHPMEGTMHEVEAGTYQLDLPLAMAGDWYVQVTIKDGEEEKVFEDFAIQAEGEKVMEIMTGYHADQQ
ncbi:FixH family protein [Anaerobacillus sp. MEB173]|uniref:FixH family protein n=1 Tax=Anaerobacillus sp. MEB173 TaxID=3383345 RepID=UPI003F8E3E22